MNRTRQPSRVLSEAAVSGAAVPPARPRAAFTLVELLIVVSIIAIAIAAILPAFGRIIESNNYAGAVNAVSATLARASAAGKDGGVVFLFDPHTQRMTLQQVELWNPDASLHDPASPSPADPRLPAIAYRPTPGVAPVELPRGTGVFGLSFAHDNLSRLPAGSPDWTRWFQQEVIYSTGGASDGRITLNCWLFPRSHVQFFTPRYDPNNPADPNRPSVYNNTIPSASPNYFQFAETFMVRYNARGEVVGSGALLGGVRDAYLEFPSQPAADVLAAGVNNWNPTNPERDDLFDPHVYYDGTASQQPIYNPETQLRPVDMLAIVDLDRLRAQTGVREPWFARSSLALQPATPPDKLAYRQDPSDQAEIIWKINRWIDDNAQRIGFGRYSGKALKQ